MSEIQHAESRYYTRALGAAYSAFLPHDDEERDRLLLQHQCLLQTFDGKALHAPVQLVDQDWVLESGTGTGIWLHDLAQQTSASPSYVGIDLEGALLPDAGSLPSNMKFAVHSVTNLPTEWTQKFTAVHQRLLNGALRRAEWEQAISEMYRVLKPGGWVQLLEFRGWTDEPALSKQREMMYRHADAVGTMWRDIAQRLPEILQDRGFINVREDTRRAPTGAWAGQAGIDSRVNLIGFLQGVKTPILKGGGYGIVQSEAEYDELIDQISKEVDATPGAGIDWTMFCAQKPFETTQLA